MILYLSNNPATLWIENLAFFILLVSGFIEKLKDVVDTLHKEIKGDYSKTLSVVNENVKKKLNTVVFKDDINIFIPGQTQK